MAKPITSLYTVANDDELELQTIAYETYDIIIKDQLFKIGQDEDTGDFFIQIRDDVKITLSSGEYQDINTLSNPEPSFRITLISVSGSPEKYVFKVEFNNPSCSDESLFNSLQSALSSDLNQKAQQSPKNWNDFNTDHTEWEKMYLLAKKGLMCFDNLPDEPKIENYS